MQLSRKVIS